MGARIVTQEKSIYPLTFDTWDAFGNGRFHISREDYVKEYEDEDVVTLWDSEYYFEGTRVGIDLMEVEKYVERDPYVYLVGYYTNGGVDFRYAHLPHSAYNPETQEKIKFENLAEVPRYVILNYRTEEIRLYKTLEEVPEEEQKIFNKWVWFWCEIPFWRTCYEKNDSNPYL